MHTMIKGLIPRRLRARGRVVRVVGVGAMMLWGIIILLSGHAQKQAQDTVVMRQHMDSSSRSDHDVRVVPAPEPELHGEKQMIEDLIINDDTKHAESFKSRQLRPIENHIQDKSVIKDEMKKRQKFVHEKMKLNLKNKIINDNKNNDEVKKSKVELSSLDKNDAQEVDLVPVIAVPKESKDGIQNHAGENLEDVYEDNLDADDVADDKISAEFNKLANESEAKNTEEKYKEDVEKGNKRMRRNSGKDSIKIKANENVIKEPLQKKKVKDDHIEESEITEINMAAVASDMDTRRQRVREVCAKNGLGPHASKGTPQTVKHPPTPHYSIFYIDRGDELAYCPTYKAASTSWLHNFAILGGLTEEYLATAKQQISEITRRLWPSLEYLDAEEAYKFCFKFMIVRHPLERLVSAYRDKLENINIGREHGVLHFYEKYGKKIVAKYRGEGKPPPANRYSQDMDDASLTPPEGVEPTFEEFVRYIIDTDLVYYSDDHWMPFYLHCTPCLLDYDAIIKFETLSRDQNYIIKKKKLEHKIKSSWKHMTKGKKTSETMKKYFATISKDQLLKLYDKYRLDFELFDYTISEYIPYVME